MYKYCTAYVRIDCHGETEVSFYAYCENEYGYHLVPDWDDPYVIWYESKEKAMKSRLNPDREVVFSRWFEEA